MRRYAIISFTCLSTLPFAFVLSNAARAAEGSEADRIIVTARGREEAQIGVPDTVTVYGPAAIAARNPDFKSNLGGQDHERFWDLLRRTGVDPNRKLRDLLDQPAGLREIDGERWYVWPDLAAKDPADLIPEKLTFQDRKRLEDLIGDEGIGRIRAGEGYPGMRTAISEEGVWIYFVLGQDGED